MYFLQSLFFQTIKVRAPSNQKILGAIEGPELPLLGMVISFYFLIIFYRNIYWNLLIFSFWPFIGTLSWNFSILPTGTFYGEVFIGTFYGYFFIFFSYCGICIGPIINTIFQDFLARWVSSHCFLFVVLILERLFLLRP